MWSNNISLVIKRTFNVLLIYQVTNANIYKEMYASLLFVELSDGNSLIALTAPWKARTKRTVFPAIESLSINLSKSQTLVY